MAVVRATEPPSDGVGATRGVVRFARDVAVNVIANLIAAAAIIYLLAVLGGLIPRSPYLVVSAIAIAFGGLGILMVGAHYAMRGPLRGHIMSIGFAAAGVPFVLTPFLPDLELSAFDSVAYPILGTGMIFVGVFTFIGLRRGWFVFKA